MKSSIIGSIIVITFINQLLIGHELYSFRGEATPWYGSIKHPKPEEYVELKTNGFIIKARGTPTPIYTYYIYPMRPVLVLDLENNITSGLNVYKSQISKKGENCTLWVIE